MQISLQDYSTASLYPPHPSRATSAVINKKDIPQQALLLQTTILRGSDIDMEDHDIVVGGITLDGNGACTPLGSPPSHHQQQHQHSSTSSNGHRLSHTHDLFTDVSHELKHLSDEDMDDDIDVINPTITSSHILSDAGSCMLSPQDHDYDVLGDLGMHNNSSAHTPHHHHGHHNDHIHHQDQDQDQHPHHRSSSPSDGHLEEDDIMVPVPIDNGPILLPPSHSIGSGSASDGVHTTDRLDDYMLHYMMGGASWSKQSAPPLAGAPPSSMESNGSFFNNNSFCEDDDHVALKQTRALSSSSSLMSSTPPPPGKRKKKSKNGAGSNSSSTTATSSNGRRPPQAPHKKGTKRTNENSRVSNDLYNSSKASTLTASTTTASSRTTNNNSNTSGGSSSTSSISVNKRANPSSVNSSAKDDSAGAAAASKSKKRRVGVQQPVKFVTMGHLRFERPNLSYAQLAALAINASPDKRATVVQIYEWVEKQYPFYKHGSTSWWKNCIRHNLSMKKCFSRERDKARFKWSMHLDDPMDAGKPNAWHVSQMSRSFEETAAVVAEPAH